MRKLSGKKVIKIVKVRREMRLCPKCNKYTYSKRLCKDCTPKKRGTGSVGRMWRNSVRWKEDEEWREKKKQGKYSQKIKEMGKGIK